MALAMLRWVGCATSAMRRGVELPKYAVAPPRKKRATMKVAGIGDADCSAVAMVSVMTPA